MQTAPTADSVQYQAPHPFYVPLEREGVESLAGEWRFRPDPKDIGGEQEWFRSGVRDRVCPVPSAWQFLFDDLRDYRGPVWYERDFAVAPAWAGKRLAVVFCGVDHYAAVWVNGQLAAAHEGGYLPFAVDVSALLAFGRPNRITVRATVPEDQLELPGDETGQGHRPGIWRPVWLEATGPTHVSDLYTVPDIAAATVTVHVEVSAPAQTARELTLALRIDGPATAAVDLALPLPASDGPIVAAIAHNVGLDEVALWMLADPRLYRLTVEILDGDCALDAAAIDFGMREIDIDGPYLRLNGEPVYLMGAMDAQDIPDKNIYKSPYSAPSDAEIRNEVVLAKQMGFNCIRKHHQIDDHRYLKWADRLGLLVYGQPPCYHRITDVSIKRFHHLLEGWVRRDRNHPSWIMWTLYNAAQGLKPMPTAYDERVEGESESKTPEEQAEMVRVSHDLVKRLDPTRPVMDTAGGEFFRGEVHSLMRYGFSGPQNFRRAREHYPALRTEQVERISGRLAGPNDPVPLIVGELGGYIYFADIDKFNRQWRGETPWPIVRGAGLGWGVLGEQMAVGYEERFYQWGLDAIYGDFARFAERHDWFAFGDLKDEVEQVRKSRDVTGYVVTMFSNIGPYAHGLLDYDMSLRPFYRELAALNRPDLLIIDWEDVNCRAGELFTAELWLSHYSRAEIKDATLRWRLEGFGLEGEISRVTMAEVGVEVLGAIGFPAPSVDQGTRARLVAELRQGAKTVADNYVDLYLYPAPRPATVQPVNARGIVAGRLREMGYDVREGIDLAIPVAVAAIFDNPLAAYLAEGGTALLLAADAELAELGLAVGEAGYALGAMPGCNFWGYVHPRSGLFSDIPSDNPMGWTYLHALAASGDDHAPTRPKMLSGLGSAAQDDVLVGCYSEWIRTRAIDAEGAVEPGEVGGLVVQCRYGRGRVVLSTLDLLGPAEVDPVAAIMLRDLIDYCRGDFAPQTRLPLHGNDNQRL